MFWDQRADTLEDQVLMPIQDSVEMGLTLDELVERVAAADYYAPLFEDAFGDGEVSSDRISRALAQFVRSIVSYRSRWDEGIAAANGDITADFENYTAQENLGKEIFFGLDNPDSRGRCAACHMPNNPLAPEPPNGGPPRDNLALFQLARPTDNGLPDDTDDGIGGVTGQQNQIGAFKSPTLRNIAQTGPYMHDGSLQTLGDVVDFYNMGIQDTPNLDPVLRAGGPGGPGGPGGGAAIQMNLSREQRDALVAFLETLTDETIAADERFSSPFPE
jgi:cytochrome c peroxidase